MVYCSKICIFCRFCTVIDIFSVEYWRESRDLEMWVRTRSVTLKVAPIDRSCLHLYYYWSAVVSLYYTIFELFDVE